MRLCSKIINAIGALMSLTWSTAPQKGAVAFLLVPLFIIFIMAYRCSICWDDPGACYGCYLIWHNFVCSINICTASIYVYTIINPLIDLLSHCGNTHSHTHTRSSSWRLISQPRSHSLQEHVWNRGGAMRHATQLHGCDCGSVNEGVSAAEMWVYWDDFFG